MGLKPSSFSLSPATWKHWIPLALLWFAFFFNQADRQLFNIVLPLVKRDLQLEDSELGLIASSFIWAIGIFVPFAGLAGDRFSKKRVVMFSLLIWSMATFLTGFGGGLADLLLLRCIVGGSEAFYAPSANTYIGEKYAGRLGGAMAVHQTSLYAGIILSGVIGALVAEHYSWRMAFFLFGGIGVLLFLVIWRLLPHDNPPAEAAGQSGVTLLTGMKELFQNRTAVLLTGAFSCLVFVNVGYLTWTPTFLHENFQLSLSDAGFSSMAYHHVAALIGVLFAGRLSDRLAAGRPSSRLSIQAGGLLLGAPFIWMMGMAGSLTWVYISLAIFGFFRGVFDSNIYASLYSVTRPGVRSSVAAAMIMIAYLTGAFAPVMLGYIKPAIGLAKGLSMLSAAYLLGGMLLLIAVKYSFETDRLKDNIN